MAILGISLGTTSCGVAVVSGTELVIENVHSFRAPWTDEKAEHIVSRLIKYLVHYHIQHVVVKLPPQSHRPQSIQMLLERLVEICTYHGCMVSTCTKSELKKHVPSARNTGHMLGFIVSHYPSLVPKYEHARKHKNQYHTKVFEAVLAAHVYKAKSG